MFKFSAQNSKPTEKIKNKLLIALLFTLTKKKSMSAFFSSLFRAAGRVYSSRLVAAALPWPLKILQPIPPAAHLESTPKPPTTRTVHPVRAVRDQLLPGAQGSGKKRLLGGSCGRISRRFAQIW
jgi:hypothetical protein